MKIESVFERLIFTTVRIETHSLNGDIGAGTGFIFNLIREQKSFLFVVTNKHVVQDVNFGFLKFNLSENNQPLLGKHFSLRISSFSSGWYFHPDPLTDIAIMPLAPALLELEKINTRVYFQAIGADLIPTREKLNEIDAIEDIIFVGYPNNIYDQKNLLPIVRKGTTATPIGVDFEDRPIFIIDASVFPGSSGSPVFLCNLGSYSPRGRGLRIASRLFFLGIISSVYMMEDINTIQIVDIPTKNTPIVTTKQMIDLGVVFKSSAVLNLVETYLRDRGEI